MLPSQNLSFPKTFVWGVAASAPQIEGAASADGKGDSIWDAFARQAGRIDQGDTPTVACDHYHRFAADFDLLQNLGLRHYRLSLAWPRIIPAGDGPVNQRGLDYYHRLFDALDERAITPWVTLFHWDLPQALEERGGWRNRATVDAFARYADLVVRTFGQRVKNWITINEAGCFTTGAYGQGGPKAPGLNEPPSVVNQTAHHALLAHGHGVRAVREHGARGSRVGITDDVRGVVPFTETEPDIAAARRHFRSSNLRFLDPVFRGGYAPEFLRRCGRDRPKVDRGDFALIARPTDFTGLNIYTAVMVRAGPRGKPEELPWPAHHPRGGVNWLRFVPQAMYWSPRFVHEVFSPRHLYITENGWGQLEPACTDTTLCDLDRREQMRNYLRELQRAVRDGVPVRGYFHWSLLDNFEWMNGYRVRFGLVHVDHASQRRTPKLSASYYAATVRENRIV